MSFLAFDLGGTRLKAGLVGDDGRPGELIVVPTPAASEVAGLLAEVGGKLLDGERAQGAGLCVPGLVSEGRVRALPGKLDGIVGVDLAGMLEQLFATRAVVVNDAIAYALGEAVRGAGRGAGRGAQRAVVVTLGTGVGVGVIEDGRPLGAGELGGGLLGGGIPIGEGGGDTSGHGGTIEALCRATRLLELTDGAYATVPDLYRAHDDGDQAALTAVARYRLDLARALIALAHAHAPEVIVVGGGPAGADAPIFDGLEALVRSWLFEGFEVAVRPGELGDAAALAGIAHLWRAP